MKVTCPHCHKPFELQVFKGSKSAKANEARRRNGILGGAKPKASGELLEHIYLEGSRDGKAWTGETFLTAIKKATGQAYSRGHGFVLLRQLKAKFPASKEKAQLGDRVSFGNDKFKPLSDRVSFCNDKTVKSSEAADVKKDKAPKR